MILASTETVAGHEAVACLGIATAEAVVSPTTAQQFVMSRERIIEVREELLFEARERALQRLVDIATDRGGDAVVGVRLDYEIVEPNFGLLLASAVGTVVKLAPAGAAP